MPVCYTCSCSLTVDNWTQSNIKKNRRICRPCLNERIKKSRKKNAEKFRIQRLTYKFNITFDEYIAIQTKQNNLCAICKKSDLSKGGQALAVDHNHTTNKVRGLLCSSCNLALGRFNDDITLLKAAISYLEDTDG